LFPPPAVQNLLKNSSVAFAVSIAELTMFNADPGGDPGVEIYWL
jgi:hypothetical protein